VGMEIRKMLRKSEATATKNRGKKSNIARHDPMITNEGFTKIFSISYNNLP